MKEITERTLKVERRQPLHGETIIVKTSPSNSRRSKVTAHHRPPTAAVNPPCYAVSPDTQAAQRRLHPRQQTTHEYFHEGLRPHGWAHAPASHRPEGITVPRLPEDATPTRGLFKRNGAEDDEAVAWALKPPTPCPSPNDRSPNSLAANVSASGLPWRRQETDILLLDEPTTYLDLAHQVELLDLFSDLNEQRGTTIVMVLHELNLAARVAVTSSLWKDGSIVAQGEAHEVLTRREPAHHL